MHFRGSGSRAEGERTKGVIMSPSDVFKLLTYVYKYVVFNSLCGVSSFSPRCVGRKTSTFLESDQNANFFSVLLIDVQAHGFLFLPVTTNHISCTSALAFLTDDSIPIHAGHLLQVIPFAFCFRNTYPTMLMQFNCSVNGFTDYV